MKTQDKEFEIKVTKLLLFLVENTGFTLEELLDAKVYDMTINRHYLIIKEHAEEINKHIFETVEEWLETNKHPSLFCTYDGKDLNNKLEEGCIKETGKQKLYIDMPHFTGRNVPVTEIAKASGKDIQYIRYGLQKGFMTFGYAYQKGNSSEYNYYCPDKKVWEELGYYSDGKD
ncbi:hypothetical protein [Thomasclavelia sp.]|uniref:hypothetical protein n=1 Tax=Thomasclavelia sp. TaxID=3025757 RepID=UPI0025D77291|nr:hypothetical protein [Thomasclavelia sp.]